VAKNEDGEYELILGNHQLLGVFFIVIILLGVFFAMGYMVGRNSSAPMVNAEAVPRRPEPKPLVVDSPAPRSTDPAPDAAPQQPVSTQPQRPSEPASAESPKPTPAPKPVSSVAPGGQPTPGTYLQLSATTLRTEAENYVDILRAKYFPALMAEIPEKPGTYRVLVGPIADSDVNKTRADLQNASFPGKDAFRKTF
jgi:cell division septation protein DedD